MTTITLNGIEYDMPIEVRRIDATRNIYSDYRGWMSPDGELHSLYGVDGHTKLARQILHYEGDNPIGALQDSGWVRIVCANSFSCKRLDENARHLLLGIVLRQSHCQKFFIEIDKEQLELSREDAIEYFGA